MAQRTGKAGPNLFIVGAAKCGTTAWHQYLSAHPDIFFPELKEPNYFALDLPRMRNFTSLGEYEELFSRGASAAYRGEASGIHLYSADAAQAIREYDPNAKILIFLRGQEHFLPSYHHQLLYRFAESIEDFETAWRLSGKRPADTIPKTCRDPALLDYRARADFRTQVERYLDSLPSDQVLVIDFDSWTADPRAAYLKILDFLGLDDDGRTNFERINEAKAFRIQWLGKMIAHPPPIAKAAVGVLKKLTGRSALGIAERASGILAAPGYSTKISAELREEIRSYYHDDNVALAGRIGSWGGTRVPPTAALAGAKA